MARQKQSSKKKKTLGDTILTVIVMIIAFAILVTLNSWIHFSNDLPTWGKIKTEFASYLEDGSEEAVHLSGSAKVHFIDVGQGQCTLIQSSGSTVLVDGGENDQGKKVTDYLQEHGVTEIDYIIATHPHSDHIGGLDVVIKNISTKNIIMPELKKSITPTTKTYLDLLQAVKDHDVNMIKAEVGNEYALQEGKFRILGPTGDFNDLNSMSVGVRFTFGERAFLITGDMEKHAEEALLETGENLSADVYLLGHHGSSTSNMMDMLRKINATYYVAQMGYDNEYGHPHRETIQRVNEMGGTLLRSDQNGTIIFTTDGKSLEVEKEKG